MMKLAATIIAWIALAILFVAPFAVYLGAMELDSCKYWMLAGTIIWFAASPVAIRKSAN